MYTEFDSRIQRVWRPVLDGQQRTAALDALAEIIRGLEKKLTSEQDEDRRRRRPLRAKRASLYGGSAGEAVLFGYLARAGFSSRSASIAVKLLERAVDAVRTTRMDPSLSGGFLGVAWAIEHLARLLPDLNENVSDGEDPIDQVESVLADYLCRSPWSGHYDLVSGLVGFGVFALERLREPTPLAAWGCFSPLRSLALTCLERILERLYELAEACPTGVRWWTPPGLLMPSTREKSPNGYYNLGLAHGVAGVISLLGELSSYTSLRSKATELLRSAVTWLLANQISCAGYRSFPSWIQAGAQPFPARLAWCYGVPGAAVALLSAARMVRDACWEREAKNLALDAAAFPAEKAGVLDAGVCHGAAGLGHIFNRLFQATGETKFRDASGFWFGELLKMRRPGRGCAGFPTGKPRPDGKRRYVWDDSGLVTGATGIGLALLAATSDVEPAWDRALLLSIPWCAPDGSGTLTPSG